MNTDFPHDTMIDDEIIEQLIIALKQFPNSIYYKCPVTAACHLVVGINKNWVEFPLDENCPAEPAAYLKSTNPVALYTCNSDDFVKLLPWTEFINW